jgi:hypothetical protein
MYPYVIPEIAYERAAEMQRSAARSRGARAVALAARQRDVLARRKLRAAPPDRPIVTARPVRPRAAAAQPSPAPVPAPDRQPVGVAARADADAPAGALTPCTTC